MRISVVGAGAVGLALGARLARAGHDVVFLVRRTEVADAIVREGVRVVDPATNSAWKALASATDPETFRSSADAPTLLCTRGAEAAAAAQPLDPTTPIVTVQNDVHNEAVLAQRFPRVIGCVVRHTCTRIGPNAVRALAGGRLVVGDHPHGTSSATRRLAEALREAEFDVAFSESIGDDKWLKLFVNLMSTPNAIVRREDHTRLEFVEVKARLLEEARDVFDAAGIIARSCDGRDRSIDEEIAHQRNSLARGTSARNLPLYNQVWAALRHGGSLEADGYHRRIIELGRRHSISTPINQRVLGVLLDAARESRGPESVAAEALL